MRASKNHQGSENLRGQGARIPEERGTRRGEPDPWDHFPLLLEASEAGKKNCSSGPVNKEGTQNTAPVFNFFRATHGVGANQKPDRSRL